MKIIAILILAILTVGSIAVPIGILNAETDSENVSMLSEIPEYEAGYGYDNDTKVMHDTNGFQYSYQADGIVKLVLPWGYTTHFSFGLTGDYLGVPQIKTALDYSWNWDILISECFNETGNLTGYSYTFTATNDEGSLDWTIAFEFNPNTRMKVTHTIENGYPNTLENVAFWYIFDLLGTATPYTIETTLGTTEGTLYQAIPDSVYWVRLANQFQFNWRDALVEYDNGYAYVGDGSVIGMTGVPILGISLDIGNIASGETISIDPYFSGIEKIWNAGSAGDASAPNNWSPVGVPDTGDNITFDGTSTYDCDWDEEVTLGNFSMLTGYTGTVTQTVDFGGVNFTIASGTLTGSATHWINCSTFAQSHNDATITGNILRLTLDTALSQTETLSLHSVVIDGNVEFASTGGFTFVRYTLIVTEGSELDIPSGNIFRVYRDPGAGEFTNNGEILGDGQLMIYIVSVWQSTGVFGLINVNVHFRDDGAITTATMSLGGNTTFLKNAIFTCGTPGNTYKFDGAGYTLTINGITTISTRVIMTQGTGVWSFGSYLQNGVSSVFNQGATLTIGGDFTVSAGVFNAIGDMTVPGSWNTATGDYANDDNVVTLTGASKTLAMHADYSFYNVTVSGTYTMDTDTTVRLRATISGTVDGTGDFIEPLPEFTSTAWLKVCPLTLYDYEVTQTYWDTLVIVDAPYWLGIYDGHIKGIPGENETGLFNVSLALTWNDMITYQNYTLIVCPEEAFVTFEFLMYFSAMLILLAINIIGACVPQVRILTLFGMFGIAILCVPTALVMWEYGPIALILILVNIMVPVMSTVNNIKDK